MANMVSISIGVAIAAYGEAKFDTWGVVLQLGAVAFEATRLVMIQILLTSKGITLNPITSLYYVAPCCLVFLSVPWIFVEYPLLRETSSFHFDFWIFGTNSLCAFALNLAVFLLVGKTSALTMNVAGVVKDWLLIAFSWSVIKDVVTPVNLLGYGVAFLGVAYYNHAKLQALKAKEAQKKAGQPDEEAGRLLDNEKEGAESTYCAKFMHMTIDLCRLSYNVATDAYLVIVQDSYSFIIQSVFSPFAMVLFLTFQYYTTQIGMKMRGSPEMRLARVGVDQTWRYRSGEGRLS
ncbi:hypothetical protein C3L33_03695, partial [Rhododendron williamsianum]